MPSRDFCDRCDNEILAGQSIFSVSTERSRGQDTRFSDLLINKIWKSPRQALSMLCQGCIEEILTVILRKPER